MVHSLIPHTLPARVRRALLLAAAPALLALPARTSAQAPVAPPERSLPSASAAMEQFAHLGLTAAQGRAIDSLTAAARAERDRLFAAHGGQPAAGASPLATLTEEERKALQKLGTDYESALQAVLMPAQRQKLAQARTALGQRHAAAAQAAAKAAYANRPTEPPAGVAPASGQGAPATAAPAGVPSTPPAPPARP